MRQPKTQTRRQLVEDARRAALDARWSEAVELNQQIIERTPRDAEAHNRLGRALLALERVTPAIEAYSSALRADPANMIARRNLQRLEMLRHRPRAEPSKAGDAEGDVSVMPRTAVFIEEVGKTWVDELVNPVAPEELAEILPAEQLQLEVEDGRLVVLRQDGHRLGEIEAKTAERVIGLIAGGNRYEVYALGLSSQSLRVILREVYRAPGLATTISFPRQITSRAYMRERDLLRQRDEADFFLLDDDDDEDDAGPAESEEEETTEPDGDTFIEETVVSSDEEEPSI
ncbi:MAG: tetratricopeptide repeat protein [Chloroflexota bacterium]|nr:tetratricopeptide repeat protein [Chloroflexota bacterium]